MENNNNHGHDQDHIGFIGPAVVVGEKRMGQKEMLAIYRFCDCFDMRPLISISVYVGPYVRPSVRNALVKSVKMKDF